MKFKETLNLIALPLALLLASLLISGLWHLFDMPEKEVFIDIVKNWFQKYGLIAVFLSALVEGVLLFGNYYPGGLVIFLGVISAEGNPKNTILVVLSVCIALFVAYFINYLLGKYGWYKLFAKFGMKQAIEKTKEKLEKHQFRVIIGSYWFPNLASITSTTAGVLKVPLRKFLIHSVIGVILWNSLWGILVASLGDKALNIINIKWVLIVVALWITIILVRKKIKRKS
jgi:membrane-associated protein